MSPFTSTSQQMIHRRIRVGIHALCAEIAVLGIAFQQPLTLQVAGNTLRNGMSQSGEFITGWRLDPAKPRTGLRGAIEIDPEYRSRCVSCLPANLL